MSSDEVKTAAATGAPTIHASAVSLAGRGLLILGASGTGKSGLALEMMSRGAVLIADDRVRLMRAEVGQGAFGQVVSEEAAMRLTLGHEEMEQSAAGQARSVQAPPEQAGPGRQAAQPAAALTPRPASPPQTALFLTPHLPALPPATLIASCPPALSGRIEARALGILNATPAGPTPLALVADLDRAEPDRLPPLRHIELLGVRLPLVLGAGAANLGAALRQMLLAGRSE